MAQPRGGLASLELPSWKTALNWAAAILLSLLFLLSGLWKITDAQGAAVRMAEARVPESLSLAAALVFGIVETLGGVLLLVPRFRRWGSISPVSAARLLGIVTFSARACGAPSSRNSVTGYETPKLRESRSQPSNCGNPASDEMGFRMSTVRIALANIQFPATPEESVALAEQAIAQASIQRADSSASRSASFPATGAWES